jgi:hypothetical protein
MPLPLTLRVGFSGHRYLDNPDAIREAIRTVLKELLLTCSGQLLGVASASAGGDLLFLESVLDLKGKVKILLPMLETDFKQDFQDFPEEEWRRACFLLRKSHSVHVLGIADNKPANYYECSVATVNASDCLIVVWDGGQPDPGHIGGTGSTVDYARKIGKPMIWIHSKTLEIQRERLDQFNWRDAGSHTAAPISLYRPNDTK